MLEEELECSGVRIKCLYAGHVLGAAMIHASCNGESVLYTGDFSTDPDKHLGAARLSGLCPDVLISESTYGTKSREDRTSRDRSFCERILQGLKNGGRVLVPVFSVGRAQELATVLSEYWVKLNLQHPIYVAGQMTVRANNQYKNFTAWLTSQGPGDVNSSPLAHPFIRLFDPDVHIEDVRPKVVLAPPGMLHGGMALRILEAWAEDPLVSVVIPGYCVDGSIGHKLMTSSKQNNLNGNNNNNNTSTGATSTSVDNHQPVGIPIVMTPGHSPVLVRCQVHFVSFSSHADSSGLLRAISEISPKNVVLVHGEKSVIHQFASMLRRDYSLRVFTPENKKCLFFDKPLNHSATNDNMVDADGIRTFKHSVAGVCVPSSLSRPFLKNLLEWEDDDRNEFDDSHRQRRKYTSFSQEFDDDKKDNTDIEEQKKSKILLLWKSVFDIHYDVNPHAKCEPSVLLQVFPLNNKSNSSIVPPSPEILIQNHMASKYDTSDDIISFKPNKNRLPPQQPPLPLAQTQEEVKIIFSPSELQHTARGECGRNWFRFYALCLFRSELPEESTKDGYLGMNRVVSILNGMDTAALTAESACLVNGSEELMSCFNIISIEKLFLSLEMFANTSNVMPFLKQYRQERSDHQRQQEREEGEVDGNDVTSEKTMKTCCQNQNSGRTPNFYVLNRKRNNNLNSTMSSIDANDLSCPMILEFISNDNDNEPTILMLLCLSLRLVWKRSSKTVNVKWSKIDENKIGKKFIDWLKQQHQNAP